MIGDDDIDGGMDDNGDNNVDDTDDGGGDDFNAVCYFCKYKSLL